MSGSLNEEDYDMLCQIQSTLEQTKGILVELDYVSSQGKQISFWVPPRGGVQNHVENLEEIWVFFGGNASTALDWIYFLADMSKEGVGILLIDYPGYGKCEGKPSPESISEAVNLAFEKLGEHLWSQLGEERSKRLLEGNVSVLGHSLGAAAALIIN